MRSAAAALTVALVAGCVEPRTSVLLRVESELAWGEGARVQSVVVEVRRDGATGPLRSQRVTALGEGAGRASLPLLIEARESTGDVSAPLWVEALGCATPNGCDRDGAVVVQRAVVRFVERETVSVTLLLASACAGVRCATSERCETTSGACVSAASDGESVDARRDAMVVDHVEVDAGTVDATDEATMDATDAGERDATAMDVATSPCPSAMVLIPAGEFDMGSTMQETEQPVHRVRLSAFCIDRTEVTVAAYRACPARACSTPTSRSVCNWNNPGRDDHPMDCLDHAQARAYCAWRGGDLPTEAQWEYAARGSDGRRFAWGNEPPTGRACWDRDPLTGTSCPVGSFPSGDSPFGLADMSGNAWEWTADWFDLYASDAAVDPLGPATGEWRVARGGSWQGSVVEDLRTTRRLLLNPSDRGDAVGFRCAAPPR